MELYESIDASKVVFAGLDKAGKSSIILALQRELSQIAMLNPTRLAQRSMFEFLGKKIAAWDLGGQERYRETYMKTPMKFFDQTSVCIFVIDIQDFERYTLAKEYLMEILAIYESMQLQCSFYILLHKSDPDFKKMLSEKDQANIEQLKQELKELNRDSNPLSFFETSIYGLLSITSAFTKIVNNIQNTPQ